MRSIIFSRSPTDVNRCGYSIDFFCPNPFATDGESATLASEAGATTSLGVPVSVAGSAYAIPIIEITINSMNPDTEDVDLTVGNAGENRYLTITDTLTAGDVITINSVQQLVYVNSTLVKPSGLFPYWSPGPGTLEYSDTATSRNIDITATYDKRYL